MDPARFEDTIVAVSTPPGRGGIGIVRLSGPEAVSVAACVFRPANAARDPLTQCSFTTCFGHVFDGEQVIDEAILTVMRAPHTYTTQDVAEISCHGGIAPVRRTLELCLKAGARVADPGEFTMRAYYYGRIDLAQAEAVADIVNATTEAGRQAAVAQLGGALSGCIEGFRQRIIDLLVEVEASIDFVDEDIELIDAAEIASRTSGVITDIDELLSTAQRGRVLREGLRVTIAGRPNVGKSSLLNALLRANRAIVAELPGTTRDVIEDVLTIGGLPVVLSDTAGVRDTDSPVEAEGVLRSRQAMAAADMVLLVIDSSEPLAAEDRQLLAALDGRPHIVVMNKEDLPARVDAGEVARLASGATVWISARDGTHIQDLEEAVSGAIWQGDVGAVEHVMLTNARHQQALEHSREGLARAAEGAAEGRYIEFVAADLHEALAALDEILGKTPAEDIISRIFEQFCIGK
ncbi:MAG TPA: tRNA uridine-5-carboxymethylaminomethyl(34) synthesis GTPase MnmE [Armatimonadetes bacterium]|jgi:tRNA modification GTPase|nr:tRNA uridine-5-carboxymethylaminomethyl(34) synthesis GTPase MnmE [Armatimonadota bacterium]